MNIDGAYHFVNDLNNPEIMWELYSSEIETATDEEVTLWLLEH